MGKVNEPQTKQYRVLDYLQQHKGELVRISDMATALRLEYSQVSSAITILRQRTSIVIDREMNGYVRFDGFQDSPNGQSGPPDSAPIRRYVEIGATPDGLVILQRDDGAIFRASQLK